MVSVCRGCGQSNPPESTHCLACGLVLKSRPVYCDTAAAVRFVGRERELELLRTRFAEAAAGRGGVVAVTGEAGIGKTWLARELVAYAAGRGAITLWGRCFEGDWQPAYGPWVDAIGEYVRVAGAESVQGEMGPSAVPLARLVPGLYSHLSETPAPTSLSPEHERLRLYDAAARFLSAVSARGAILLVLDDLHWADAESLHLLSYLARFLDRLRVLVLCVYRDYESDLGPRHPLPELLAVLQREVDPVEIHVGGFSLSEVATYLREAAGQKLPDGLARTVHAATNGNPFFVRELVRYLVDEGLLRGEGHGPPRLKLGEVGIPAGIRQIVDMQLARLSPETARLLRMAAGFTAGFTFAALQAVTELPEEALLNCLDEAMGSGFVCVTESTPPLYDFAQSIVRQTIYQDLNPDRRARLHRRIAGALETLYAGRDNERAGELAAHYHASRALPGAEPGLTYALAAAEQASTGFSPEHVVEYLRMAVDLATACPPRERADILCRLAIAQTDALLLEDAARTTQTALAALAAAEAGPERTAGFVSEVARGLKDGGANPEVWQPLVARGLALVQDRRDLTWARLALLEDRFELLHVGPFAVGRWLGSNAEAVALARAQGTEADHARTLEPADWHTRAEADAALAASRTWHDPEAVMTALNSAGRYLLYREGAFADAVERYEELLAVSRQYGALGGQAEALMQLAVAHAAVGQLAEAQAYGEEAREMLPRLGAAHGLHFIAEALLGLLAYFLDGDWPSFAAAANRFAGNPTIGRSHLGLFAVAMAAYAHARSGDAAAAHRFLDPVTTALPRASAQDFGYTTVLAAAASAAWEISATEYGSTYRRLAAEVIKLELGESPIGPHELWLARSAALMADYPQAAEYFARARQKAESRGHRPLRAIVDFDEAVTLARAGREEKGALAARLEATGAAFAELGMQGWAGRARALRERLVPVQPAVVTAPAYPDGLTAREVEVLNLVAGGLTNREIAAQLVLSLPTVERHIANIYRKIDARGRADATAYALRHGLAENATQT